MAAKETRSSSDHLRRWSLSEKRRIVELTHSKGASISEIALAHGLHPTSLSHWRSLYRAGKLSDASPRAHPPGATMQATLLPVMISTRHPGDASVSQAAVDSSASLRTHENAVIHVSFSSGATLRVEIGSLDVTFVRALLAELRG
jgi:transposase-like protein